MRMVSLEQAGEEAAFGGKAAQLAVAAGHGLPVPPGVALDADAAARLAARDPRARVALDEALAASDAVRYAVRSSAIGEDSATASFAGQHMTRLNVARARVPEAVGEVWASASSTSALAYRRRIGVKGEAPATGVVVQVLVTADVAGVLFTRDPITGADERVIEASWGLGEAIVAGHVVPDRFRLARTGAVLERSGGVKDLLVTLDDHGGTVTRPVEGDAVHRLCLDDPALVQLAALADGCEAAFSGSRDVEWAFAAGQLWLLQARPITAGPA